MHQISEIEKFLEFLGDAILITNENSQIMFANTSCLNLFDYSKSDFEGMTIDKLIEPGAFAGHGAHGKHGELVRTYIRNNKSTPKVMISRSVMSCVNSKGKGFHARISIASLNINGEQCGIATIQDYSSIKHKIDTLKIKANTDALTGLFNRAYLDEVVTKENLALWSSNPVGIVYFDLNKFKQVNDAYGHCVGDQLLIEISERLKKAIRSDDLLFRVGGDEFLLLFSASNADDYRKELEAVGHKIHQVICKPVDIPKLDKSLTVGASIGLGVYPHDNENMSSLITMVDKSMYESKRTGTTFTFVDKG